MDEDNSSEHIDTMKQKETQKHKALGLISG